LNINEAMARQFFPSQDPIGKQITFDFVPNERPREIVGVVGDTITALDSSHHPAMHVPHLQQSSQWISTSWMLRAGTYFLHPGQRRSRAPDGRSQGCRRGRGPEHAVAADMATVEQILDNQTRTLRFYMLLLGIFATVAA
jgi:hypothetical protein